MNGSDAEEPFDVIIEPGRAIAQYWRDLWAYRELFYFLSWRDILVRYKQTAIGIAWSVIRPLLAMVIFTLIFGRLAGLPSSGVPYPILVLVGMLPWQFFANSLSEGSSSLIVNASMLTKVYFPRLIIPASAVVVNLVDFFISLAMLAALMAWYGMVPGLRVLFLPVLLLLALIASLGFGIGLAVLNVKYRDFRYIVPFIVQLGIYVSPVGFTSRVIPDRWRLVYSLNPMVGVIDAFRWAILGEPLHVQSFLVSAGVTLVACVAAVWYFRRTEEAFADVV